MFEELKLFSILSQATFYVLLFCSRTAENSEQMCVDRNEPVLDTAPQKVSSGAWRCVDIGGGGSNTGVIFLSDCTLSAQLGEILGDR